MIISGICAISDLGAGMIFFFFSCFYLILINMEKKKTAPGWSLLLFTWEADKGCWFFGANVYCILGKQRHVTNPRISHNFTWAKKESEILGRRKFTTGNVCFPLIVCRWHTKITTAKRKKGPKLTCCYCWFKVAWSEPMNWKKRNLLHSLLLNWMR